MPLSRQQQHQCNRPHPTAALAAVLLLSCCVATPMASPINERPGNVLTMILADCGKYQNWLSIAAAFAWRQSGQPGSMIRVANCAPNEANDPGSLKIAQYVKTFIAKQYTWYEPLNDHYPAYNKPGAVVDYFAHHNSTEDWVVILDSDMLVKNPFLPEELPLDRGWAYAAGYSYLKGVNNNLALRNVPEVVPRNDTFGGPVGRRGDKVGGPYFMHADDLRKLAPQWLNYTYIMRNDSEAYSDSGQDKVKKGDRIWIAEMYGYSFGAAKSNVWHKIRDDFMMYPGYAAGEARKVIHAGLLIKAGDWQFQKHWFMDFDVQQCPPWNLTGDRPKAGIFPPPPHPDKLTNKDFHNRYADLLSTWTIAIINAGICDYHARNCPPSQQLTDVCNEAFKLYHDINKELRDKEWQMPCLDTSEKCVDWAKNGECTKNKEYMAEYCKLSCTKCTPRNGTVARPVPNDQLQPLTVAAVQAEAGVTTAPSPPPVAQPHTGHFQHKSSSTSKTARPVLAASQASTTASESPMSAEPHTGSAGAKGAADHSGSSVTYDTLIRRCATLMSSSPAELKKCIQAAKQNLSYHSSAAAAAESRLPNIAGSAQSSDLLMSRHIAAEITANADLLGDAIARELMHIHAAETGRIRTALLGATGMTFMHNVLLVLAGLVVGLCVNKRVRLGLGAFDRGSLKAARNKA